MDKGKLDRILKIATDISIGVLIVVAVAMAFGPKLDKGTVVEPPKPVAVSADEVAALAVKTTFFTADGVAKKLVSADGKPTLLVLYATWCPYCRQLLPTILALQEEKKLAGVHVFFLSIDSDKLVLAEYLLAHRYQKTIKPLMLDGSQKTQLMDMLGAKGSYFSGNIPYSVWFDSKGELLQEMPGLQGKERILEAVEKITENKQP